jgi:hypothetical protein
MLRSTAVAVGIAALSLAFAAAPASAKTCVTKAGEGTGGSRDSAEFQAYEAVLQATDWGMWGAWMASSQKVGVAPGYSVTNLKKKCSVGGGLGHNCVIQATLCK